MIEITSVSLTPNPVQVNGSLLFIVGVEETQQYLMDSNGLILKDKNGLYLIPKTMEVE